MTLSKSESVTNEILFGLLTAWIIFLAASLLTWLNVPLVLIFLATVFMCKVYWFPPEAPEAPINSFCRSTVNLLFLGLIYILALFSGSFFARKITLTDAYELYKKKWVTSDHAFVVYLTYNFVYYLAILVFVHGFRIIENFFTALAGGARDKMKKTHPESHPSPTPTPHQAPVTE